MVSAKDPFPTKERDMGNFWSRRSEKTATTGHVPRRQRTRAARDYFVKEDTGTSLQDSQPTDKATTLQTKTQNEGYGKFCVTVESLLTRPDTEQLATWFGYSPSNIDKIISSDNPSRILVRFMDQRGEISPTDITKLTEALKHETIGLSGVAVKIEEAFTTYRPIFDSSTLMNAKTEFVSQLKQRYVNQYDAVQPIPYIRDRLFCVDRVFVEGGIEYFIVDERTRVCERWGKLNSYKDIFRDVNIKSVRRIIEGEPGFGKSTLTLQVAYDWCNGIAGSVSEKYEILILLRLKQLGGVKSIYRAIKRFILPTDSSLSESDIQKILKENRSVLVILDGFDEYPEQDDDRKSHVWRIIKMDMFQTLDVVLTTRTACLPKDFPPQTKRIRLTGFDDQAQEQYIRKAVVGNDEEATTTLMRRLQENPVVADLCQVPLFFAMFAHISCEGGDLEEFKSVTRLFQYMIWCFHHHMRNKMKDENVQMNPVSEDDHYQLDRIAFEGLSKKHQQLIWGKEELFEKLGQDVYDYYVRLGILVEDKVAVTPTSESFTVSNFFQEKTEVRFYHKLFCEWYAANFVASYAAKNNVRFVGGNVLLKGYHRVLNRKDVSGILKKLDPFDLQYVFRFACGLNQDASGKIIKYLQTQKHSCNDVVVLCIAEKGGNMETILDSIRALCSSRVGISFGHTLLLQRSTIELLDVATARGISISFVDLFNCYSTVDLRGGNHLQLKSNLSIPVLTTLNTLWIYEEGREITSEEFTGILQYSSKCLALKKLMIAQCLLPPSVQAESVSVLRSRNVKVTWVGYYAYQLNLQSCLWEVIDDYHRRNVIRMMTDDDYQNEVSSIKPPQDESEGESSGEEWN